MSSGVGLITEQAWEFADLAALAVRHPPETASIGFRNGKPAGSASALTWSAGQFVRLMLDVVGGPGARPPALHGRSLHPPHAAPDDARASPRRPTSRRSATP